jgi:23S rRNA pseudouridine1911/1915/1917 synthase
VYLAVVYGNPDPPSGTWRDRLVWDTTALIQKETHPRDPRGTDAICEYTTLESFRDASLLEIRLETGRRNQIRIQARLRGHTLVGEQRYTYGPDSLRTIAFGRHALHAKRLAFRHPVDERSMEFEAPLPKDLEDLLARLRKSRA